MAGSPAAAAADDDAHAAYEAGAAGAAAAAAARVTACAVAADGTPAAAAAAAAGHCWCWRRLRLRQAPHHSLNRQPGTGWVVVAAVRAPLQDLPCLAHAAGPGVLAAADGRVEGVVLHHQEVAEGGRRMLGQQGRLARRARGLGLVRAVAARFAAGLYDWPAHNGPVRAGMAVEQLSAVGGAGAGVVVAEVHGTVGPLLSAEPCGAAQEHGQPGVSLPWLSRVAAMLMNFQLASQPCHTAVQPRLGAAATGDCG
ncbi:hypothetical protein HaLaN_09923 [Haematococcus lacustris]|uniref:Uncharacterized protein n=1 Tax=Haematococcus lacustris TaxID=44745 RepID=A0A699Z4W0_HAELA|nr:hypothetical protein HaLaN_09923 [Haematococcus lacustris]